MFDWIDVLEVVYFLCTVTAVFSLFVAYSRLKAATLSHVVMGRLASGKRGKFRWGKRNDVQMTLALLVCGVCPIINAMLGASLIRLMLREH
jgi:hypothetical protein